MTGPMAALFLTVGVLVLTWLHQRKPIWFSKLLLSVAPRWERFAPHWRWAVMAGECKAEDASAYSSEHHHHLTKVHEREGDIFVRERNGKKVLFVRSAMGTRHVLISEDFAKVWQTDDGPPKKKTAVEYVHNLVQPLLTDPVFAKKGSSNREARTLMSPLFRASTILASAFAMEVDHCLDGWPVRRTGRNAPGRGSPRPTPDPTPCPPPHPPVTLHSFTLHSFTRWARRRTC